MPLQDPNRPIYFPRGRGKCRDCGADRYRSGLCREHYFAKIRANYKPKVRERNCTDCRTKFTTTRSFQKYCSYRCQSNARNARERVPVKPATLRGEQRQLPLRAGFMDGKCEQCDRRFRYKRMSSERKARFCSSKCFYISNSGASSVLKRDGVFHCPPDKVWKSLCADIRAREKGLCACCGNPPRAKRSLPVDHIIPRRVMFAWGIDPHQLFNLVAVCIPCHARKTFVEACILVGDFAGFVRGLEEMNYPMDRVREAFIQLGLPTQTFRSAA